MGKDAPSKSSSRPSTGDPWGDTGLDKAVVRTALAAAGVGVWGWDVSAGTVAWSPEVEILFGQEPGAFGGSYDAYRAAVHEEDRAAVEGALGGYLKQAQQDPSAVYMLQHRIVRPDGEVRWVECRGRLLEDDPDRMAGTVTDITDRKTAEDALRVSQERYQSFSELSQSFVYEVSRTTPDQPLTIMMGAFERTTGLTREQVRARGGWLEVIHVDDRETVRSGLGRVWAGQQVMLEYRVVDGAGEVRWLRDRARPVIDDRTGAAHKMVGVIEDISPAKVLEHQLMHARRLEALARLSGGVAHDFNNLIMLSYTSLDFLHSEAQRLSPEGRQALEDLAYAAQRSAEVTRSLLTFGRQHVDDPRQIDAAALLHQLVKVFARTAGPKIRIEVEVCGEDLLVRVDPGQLQLVLLNLILNAKEAMNGSGTVRMKVWRAELEEHDGCRPGELAPGPYVGISVSDSGQGMDASVLQQLFEPFFTTKRPHGNGMGLATSHGIVRQAGGGFSVESEIGVGSTFRLYLPLVNEAAVDSVNSQARVNVGGNETVLVVEDEPSVRRFVTGGLVSRGYTVLEADSAEHALELCAHEKERVDLLLTDVHLPGIDGLSLAQRLIGEGRCGAALLITGFINERLAAEPLAGHTVAVLAKPFTAEGLCARVRDLLDALPESAR